MFLPVGDTPNPRNYTPWVTWGLIAVNIAIFLLVSLPQLGLPVDIQDARLPAYWEAIRPSIPANVPPQLVLQQTSAYSLFTFEHGYKPGAPAVDDLFFSLFLHGGWMHLIGNMLFLWIYGDNVEHRLGRVLFLLMYLVTGVVATWTFAVFAGDSMTPLVGASGAISGVLGFYFLWFPRNQVKVFIFLFPLLMDVFLVPARLVLGIYVIVDNLLPALASSNSNVAHGAHLGGFIAGLALAAWLGRTGGMEGLRERSRKNGQAPPEDLTVEGDDPWNAAAKGPLPQVLRWAHYYRDQGWPQSAIRLLRMALRTRRSSAEEAELLVELGELYLTLGHPTTAWQHLLDALDRDPPRPIAQRARAGLTQIQPGRR